jgi:hypothetical protein
MTTSFPPPPATSPLTVTETRAAGPGPLQALRLDFAGGPWPARSLDLHLTSVLGMPGPWVALSCSMGH